MGISKDALEKGADSWTNKVVTFTLLIGGLLAVPLSISKCDPNAGVRIATPHALTPSQDDTVQAYKTQLLHELDQ